MKVEEALKQVADLSKKTALNILHSQQIISDHLAEVFKAHDLSVEQYNVLRILRGSKTPTLNMSDIQERMIARTSNTTRLVDKLLAKSYVNRQVCPHNRRKMEVQITDAGRELLLKIDPLVTAAEQQLASNLTQQEQEQLNILLEKYRGKI